MKSRLFVVLDIILIMIIIVLHQAGVTLFNCDISGDSFEACLISEAEEKNYVNAYLAMTEGQKFIIYINKKDVFECGDIIRLKGTIDEPKVQRNYRGFDYSLYLKSKKIVATIRAENVEKIGENRSPRIRFRKLICSIRKNIFTKLESNISKKSSDLLKGILVGDTSELEDEVKENFRKATLAHMLAISGTHFGYVILFSSFILKKMKFKRLQEFLTMLIILFFMCLTGMTASVVRAGIMAIIIILASLFKRKADSWTSMAISLLIQILYNPYSIFEVGLQLSFGGVIGIVLFAKPIELLFNKIKEFKLNKPISVALGANVVVMPLMMYQFSTISLTFVISNLLAGGILGILIIFGFVSLFLNIRFLYSILDLLVSMFLKIVEICSKIPFSSVYIKTPSMTQLILIYVLIFLFYLILKGKVIIAKVKKAIAFLLIIVFSLNIRIQTNNLTIHFIDVGQGDSCLMLHKNYAILLDGGGSKDSSFDVGKNTLLPYFLARKIKRIDYMIVSHFDADHAQGFIYVLMNVRVKNTILPIQAQDSNLYQEFISICKSKNINIIYVQRGDNFSVGNLHFEVLHPSTRFISDNPMNNNALVLKMNYYNTSVLFTGDIEALAEQELVKTCKGKLKADILKVGHHGSKSSTTEDFLKAVSPEIALIGVGKDNTFGHPSGEVVERLKKRNIKIFRTDESGEISIRINKNRIVSIEQFATCN